LAAEPLEAKPPEVPIAAYAGRLIKLKIIPEVKVALEAGGQDQAPVVGNPIVHGESGHQIGKGASPLIQVCLVASSKAETHPQGRESGIVRIGIAVFPFQSKKVLVGVPGAAGIIVRDEPIGGEFHLY